MSEELIGQKPPDINLDMKALASNVKMKNYFLVFPMNNAMKAISMTAINLISLYGALVVILPQFGIPRFCIVSGDGKEILADASLPEMSKTLKEVIGAEIIVPGAAAQRALASGQAVMRNGGL